MMDKRLLQLLGEDRKYLPLTVASMSLGLLGNLGVTASICMALTLAVQWNPQTDGLILFLGPALLGILGMGLRYLSTRVTGYLKDLLGRKAKKRLRREVYGKILRLGSRSAGETGMAGLTQVSLEGVEQLDLYYSTYIPQFFYAMLAPMLLFETTVWIYWPTAVVLLACVPLIPLSIIMVSRYAKKIFARYWNKYITMGDGFLDSVQGLRELKIFQADGARQQEMNRSSQEFRKITMKVLVMQLASTTIMDLVAYGGAGLGVALTLWGLGRGELSWTGALFLILVAVEFFLPLRAFGAAFHVAMNGVSAGGKILDLLATPEPAWGREEVKDTTLALDQVSFAYVPGTPVLENVTLTFPQKGMTAIVGESGCGKSTLAALLAGTIQPQKGKVLLGGRTLEEYARESWYDHLVLVSYNTYIFNATVRENFLLANPQVTEEEIWQALEQVNLAGFIRERGGLDEKIQEEGANLSGGQKQRLALGVNLVCRGEVYIFDEATSNIDPQSEAIVMANIRRLARTKNVIVISHRLANVVPADRIFYMERGAIREEGTHEELMSRQGGYARLYTRQRQLEEGYKEEAV